jgi:hypothetical protein
MGAAASRQRQYRQRVRDGRVVLSVEVDETGLAAVLEVAGLIKAGGDDRDDLEAGLERLVEMLIGEHNGRLR